MIAFYVPVLCGRAYPPQTRWSRDADSTRKLDIGHAAILLQLVENLPVDGIETSAHGNAPDSLLLGRIVSNSALPAAKDSCPNGIISPTDTQALHKAVVPDLHILHGSRKAINCAERQIPSPRLGGALG